MDDLLAVILVGLVVLSAVVSVYVILTGPSRAYSELDYPGADTRDNSVRGNSSVITAKAGEETRENIVRGSSGQTLLSSNPKPGHSTQKKSLPG